MDARGRNKLVGTGSVGGFTEQGSSVALSGDGSTAIVGGFSDNLEHGAVWIFSQSNASTVTIVPTVITSSVSVITSMDATGGGNITSDGGATVTASGIVYSSTNNVPTLADIILSDGTTTGTFVSNLTGLTCGTLYYVRAYATNSVGTSYGNVETFTTPTTITYSISDTACGSYTLNAQTYTLSGTYNQNLIAFNGCDSSITLNLTINNSSTSSISETACESFILNAQTYAVSGTYIQNLTAFNGCDSTISLNLTINYPSTATLTDTSCDSYSLNAQTYTASGTYRQNLKASNGCDSILTLKLTIYDAPNFNLGNDTILCLEDVFITLDVTTENATYLWQDSSKSPFLNVTQYGVYTVEVSNKNCKKTESIIIGSKCESEAFTSNVFTPNFDNINDEFRFHTENITILNCRIYNRWGVLIRELRRINESWDGRTMAGEECPSGVYYYLLEYQDTHDEKKNLNGFVQLLR